MEFPAMPLWIDAYVADTAHLTYEEHGVYLKLLMTIWRSPGCRIPNDRKWIERHMMVTPEFYDQTVAPLIEEFCQTTGNYVSQKRLKKERDFVAGQREKQSARAKSRWNKDKVACRGNAAPHASGNAPTPTPILKEDTLSTDVLNGADAPKRDPDFSFYDEGKKLLGPKSGGVLTKLKAAFPTIGEAHDCLRLATHKQNPMEYIQGAIRQHADIGPSYDWEAEEEKAWKEGSTLQQMYPDVYPLTPADIAAGREKYMDRNWLNDSEATARKN
tara:strand:+ start:1044 stop:1859 length:816 start_codon:yes stop_codon:yes gene_type:complete